MDAPAETLCAHEAPVSDLSNETVLTATLAVPDGHTVGHDLNVWAHLSLSGEKQIRPDDYITTRVYQIPPGVSSHRITVELQPVTRP
jgi:hypothetical protein